MKVLFLSTHSYESRRRAGFHWLADSFHRDGNAVLFVTVGMSPISFMRSDHRIEYSGKSGFNRPRAVKDGLSVLYWLHPFHVFNTRISLANRLLTLPFSWYAKLSLKAIHDPLRTADLIIVESSLALAFVPRIRALAPDARIVYRVSDDVSVVGNHPILEDFEKRAVPHFDAISVPSDLMAHKFPGGANVKYHGIEKDVLDEEHTDPYLNNSRPRVLTMGTTLFDQESFLGFADACPEADFHFFGSINHLPTRPNVFNHGEVSFGNLVPFIQHCDVGLAPYRRTAGAEYLAHTSNKLMQFTYCRKPVLLPRFISSGEVHIIPYDAATSSYVDAFQRAMKVETRSIDRSRIGGWDEVRDSLIA